MKFLRLLFYILFLGLMLPNSLVLAQKDSLLQVFKTEIKPEKKLKIGVAALNHVDNYKDPTISLVHKDIYPQLPDIIYSPETFEDLRDYIYVLTKIGAYDEADASVKWALKNITSVDKINFKSRLYFHQAQLYNYQGKREEVFKIFESALIEMTSPEPILKARIKMETGRLHYDLGSYDQAMEHYIKALDIFEKENVQDGFYVDLMHFIGSVFKRQNQDEKALDYYKEMLMVAEKIGSLSQQAEALYLLADLYAYAGDYKKEEEYLWKALRIYRGMDSDLGVAQILLNLSHGEIYDAEYDSVLMRLEEVELLTKKANVKDFDFTIERYYGKVYARLKDYDKSMDHFTKALDIIGESEVKKTLNYTDIYRNLAFVEYDKGNYQAAFDYLDLHLLHKDTLISEENQQIVHDLEQKYENKKNEAEILALNKDKEIKAKELERKNTTIKAFIGGIILVLLLASTIYYSLLQNKKKNKIITLQKHEVETKNREIMDSITYAKRIQNAILPPRQLVKEYLTSSFIIYKPKDIVAGDFYWMEPTENGVIFAAADCTGHGVPGAMVSVVCNNGLNRSVREFGLKDPGKILDKTRELVIQEFEKSDDDVKDGMDISLVSLTHTANKKSATGLDIHSVSWAGANNPLWIIRNGSHYVEEIKADKQAIGKTDNPKPFTTHNISLNTGDRLYIFSDGYVDQFGGARNKKFKSKSLKELLLTMKNDSMDRQREILEETFESWKGDFEQIDDICMIGLMV